MKIKKIKKLINPVHLYKYRKPYVKRLAKLGNKNLQNLKTTIVKLRDKNLRNMSERLCNLQGKYKGQRCFIMGTGPSLNKMDLEMFKNEYVWGLNKCYLLFDRISWRPSFYIGIDRRVVSDISREINQLAIDLPQTKFFFPAYFRVKRVLSSDSNVYWYHETPFSRKIHLGKTEFPATFFTRDAAEWISGASTVTIAALQLAVYLGFNPIYLIGCDTSYSIPSTVRFEGERTKLLSTEDDDPNHFDPRYFGKGGRWSEPGLDKMIFDYKQAKKACDFLGVSVYNATVGGKLEVFPRIDYKKLF